MASKISQYRHARYMLEDAIARLIRKASDFPNTPEAWQTRELLQQAREYGRAFNRVEKMRGRK